LAHQDVQAAQATEVHQVQAPPGQNLMNGKRKREHEEATPEKDSTKKTKSNDPEAKDELLPVAPQIKRDREHATIIVERIPSKATEGQVKHFFRDCGTIKSLKLVEEKHSQTATIEFESQEEATYSLIKSGKPFQGVDLNVRFGTGCTIFVTNYPPEADKAYLENLFEDCGEIVDVRMPSLIANTKRRFAYIQFLDPHSALKATQLNDKVIEGKYKLVAAISDPTKAGDRAGAQAEGREVFMGNVYWWVREDEIKTLMESAGEIESVRIPRNIEGKSKGSAFVVFKTQEGAQKAAKEYDDFMYKGRKLHVEITSKRASRITTNILRGSTMSPTPDSAGSPTALPNGRSTEGSTTGDPEPGARDHKERTIALLNVPDTVTAARLQKLVEHYGEIKKFTLRPDHGGAIVEFAEVASVGKAQLAFENFELEDHKLRVGTVPELFKQQAEVKEQKVSASKSKKVEKKSTNTFGAPVHRPTQNFRGRGGRRGGLGFTKRTTDAVKSDTKEATGPKSNEYFRDLMDGKAAAKKQGKETKQTDQPEPELSSGEDLLDDIIGGKAKKTNGGGAKPAAAAEGIAGGDDDGLLDDLMED
jgi:RNA recognition motif-containing protein